MSFIMLVLLGKNKKTMRSCFNWDSSLLEYAWFMRGKRETLRGLASSGKDTCLSLPARDFSLSFSVSFTDSYCFHLYWLSSPWEVRRNGALTVFVQCGKEEVKIYIVRELLVRFAWGSEAWTSCVTIP